MDQQHDVRVQPDSQHDLDELFRVAVGQARPDGPNCTPLRLRNLPPSFFTPPDPAGSKSASHSRESSLDQQSPSPLSPAANPSPPAIAMHTGSRHVAHLRAHSSPATLPSSLSVAPVVSAAGPLMSQPITAHHVRQLSYDVDKLKMPEHWEVATDKATGKRYFIDHKNRTTTWDDPRLRMLQEMQQQHQQMQFLQKQQQRAVVTTSLPDLPDDWEQKRTVDGEMYFVNHSDRTTTWNDPRIPAHLQKQSSLQTSATALTRPPPPPIGALSATLTGLSSLNGSADFKPNLRVQMLLKEREKYRQRSQEILSYTTLSEDSGTGTVTGMDAFLGNSDCHSRQESSDSGLGLGSFSLPRTPDGVLSSDADDRNPVGVATHTSEDLGLDLLNITSMDLGNDNMDSDDLMSALPVLPEDLQDLEAILSNNSNKNSVWL